MTWFVDASVIVALAAREDDWERWSKRLDEEEQRLWSPVSRWESIAGTRLRREADAEYARAVVDDIAQANGLRTVSIGDAEAQAAFDAYLRYGRRSGSRAKLNMGDCFAYACARTNDARLLYKGDDFSHTDMAL